MNDIPTPPTLHELITALADRQDALAVMQDKAEQAQEHCHTLEGECALLRSTIGKAAVKSGEIAPHPAIQVDREAFGTELKYPLVTIEADLSRYHSDDSKRARWCAGCTADPDKCGGSVGVSCERYPLFLETDGGCYDCGADLDCNSTPNKCDGPV